MMTTLASSFRQSLLRLISGSDSKESPQRSLNELPQSVPPLSVSYVPLSADTDQSEGSESSNTLVNYPYNQSGDDTKSVDIAFEPARVPSLVVGQNRTLSTWLAHWIVDRPQVAAQSKNAVLPKNFPTLSDRISRVLIDVDPSCLTILVSLEYLDRILSITPLAGIMEETFGLRTMYVLFLVALELAFAREGPDSVISSEHWKPAPSESAAKLREHYLGCLQTELRLSDIGGWLTRFEVHANGILCDFHDSDVLDDFFRTARAEFESMRDDESVYGTPPSSPSLPSHSSPEDVRLRKEKEIRDFCATLDAITTAPPRESVLQQTSSSSSIRRLDAQEDAVRASGRVAEPINSPSIEVPLSPEILQDEISHAALSDVLSPLIIDSIIPVNDHVTPETLDSVPVELSPLHGHFAHLCSLPSPQSPINSRKNGVSLFQSALLVDVEATRAYYDQQPLPLIVFGPPVDSSHAGTDIVPVQRPPAPPVGKLLTSYELYTPDVLPSTRAEVPGRSEANEEERILIGDISLMHDTPLQDRAEQGAMIWDILISSVNSPTNHPPSPPTLGHIPLPGSIDHHLFPYTGEGSASSTLSTLGIIGHSSALGLILDKEFPFHCPRPTYGARGFILMGEECFYDYRFDYFRPHFRPRWHEHVRRF
ncbi:hypothetical protein Moror_16388 [Moniliophthora roreri MCA 2997]|nr:hypothetical protein Moror_16388 [Moniliophthora roreri MCA 2997]